MRIAAIGLASCVLGGLCGGAYAAAAEIVTFKGICDASAAIALDADRIIAVRQMILAEDAAGHPVSQLVADVVGGSDKLPEQFDPEAPVGRIHVPQPAPEAAPAELSGHAAADALKQAWPDCEIDMLVYAATADVLRDGPGPLLDALLA